MGKRNNRIRLRYGGVRRRLLIERLGQRQVLAAITGTVFDDANHSFQFEDDEIGAAERLVFIDADDNAQLNPGEPYTLSNLDGSFTLDGLAEGTFLVRVFNGTESQVQTFPVEASVESEPLLVSGGHQLAVFGDAVFALTEDSIFIGDLISGDGQILAVGDQLNKLQSLPDGKILILGSDESGDTAWLVDPVSPGVTPVAVAQSNPPIEWSDAAIDSSGRGVLIEQSSGDVYAIATDGSFIATTKTIESVSTGTHVLTSKSGMLTVIAEPNQDETELRLWSNETSSYLPQPPIAVPELTELLAYDDAAGLLAARMPTAESMFTTSPTVFNRFTS